MDSFGSTQAGSMIYVYQDAIEALKKGYLIQPGRIVRKTVREGFWEKVKPQCTALSLEGWIVVSQVKMRGRERSGQKEEYEQRVGGRKYHGCLGEIQASTALVAEGNICGRRWDYGTRLWWSLELILYVHVSSCVACRLCNSNSRIFAEMQV